MRCALAKAKELDEEYSVIDTGITSLVIAEVCVDVRTEPVFGLDIVSTSGSVK